MKFSKLVNIVESMNDERKVYVWQVSQFGTVTSAELCTLDRLKSEYFDENALEWYISKRFNNVPEWDEVMKMMANGETLHLSTPISRGEHYYISTDTKRALSTQAFNPDIDVYKAWKEYNDRQNALKNNEHGMDLTF